MAESQASPREEIPVTENLRKTRSLTAKGREQFDTLKSEHFHKLESVWTRVEQAIQNIANGQSINLSTLRSEEKSIMRNYDDYRKLVSNYKEFLLRYGGLGSDLETINTLNAEREIRAQDALENLDKQIQAAMESISLKSSLKSVTKSANSSASHLSDTSSVLKKMAKAEAARLKVEFAIKENQLKKEAAENVRRNAELAADLELLEHKKEAAAVEAEVRVLQSVHSGSERSVRSNPLKDLPKDNPSERTQHFVLQHAVTDPRLNPQATQFVPPAADVICQQTRHEDTSPSNLTKYVLKKDLLFARLTKYGDKPELYALWKASFKSIISELQVSPNEEMDLLSKWLGPESSRHALSIRAANVNNPALGLTRIWDRLDERYGSPEVVEASVKAKLDNFPKLSNKDYSRLYDLSDIVSEIESLKEDDKYSAMLSYFDASTGVIPIVRKLPYSLQDKWTSRAVEYKERHNVSFPPFWVFAKFLRDMSRIKNDPSFIYDDQKVTGKQGKTYPGATPKPLITTRKTDLADKRDILSTDVRPQWKPNPTEPDKYCPVHKSKHSLNQCKGFRAKPIQERRQLIKDFGICFKCCASTEHSAKACTAHTECTVCKSNYHPSALHIFSNSYKPVEPFSTHGEELSSHTPGDLHTKCTKICGDGFKGKSCAKTMLVRVFPKGQPEKSHRMYAIMDDQSNSSLVNSQFFNIFNVKGETVQYTLSSCSGTTQTSGRRANGFVIEALDGVTSLELPILTECNEIPNIRDEIPTPEVAENHSHLNRIKEQIPPLDDQADILLLLGRDIPEVHHVHDQIIGPRNSPYAQQLKLGWVIVGEACLGQAHKPQTVNVNKTHLLSNGRPSICEPCTSQFKLKQNICQSKCSNGHSDLGSTVFIKTKNDENPGLSIDDQTFLEIMNENMTKDPEGKWISPLPFRVSRPKLPNNRQQALNRAKTLNRNLQQNPVKKQHMVTFMEQIFRDGNAEPAPAVDKDQEVWYLPIFGVYHPQKPTQIRGVFDSSAQHMGLSLNSVLLTGPDLTNSLLGILLRFRREPVAVVADIQQMFYSFLVRRDHRNYLRFFWYRDNNPDNDMIEYQMCVHVFGNSPSPAIATYGLRLTADLSANEFGTDTKAFVDNDFYVDDGLTSLATPEEAISLMQRTQSGLWKNGKLRLHKIASNSPAVMSAFPAEDRAKDLKELDLTTAVLPTQRTLGLTWNLHFDSFAYKVCSEDKPFTRRGVLSIVNSLYDPLGFIAPVTVQGKILLRNMASETKDWDEPLPEEQEHEWKSWRNSLEAIQDVKIQRTYAGTSFKNIVKKELHIFADASEQAIASAAYLRTTDKDNNKGLAFVLGKAKVAPLHGHTIPRLELCAAVLAVELQTRYWSNWVFLLTSLDYTQTAE